MINIENLNFTYSKHSKLFDNLNLSLTPGNIYGLLGKNGTGKTTLFKLMTGLLMPKSGVCKVFDLEATKRYPSVLAELFIIPEEFELPAIKMMDYVMINSPFYPKFNKSEFEGYLKDFELKENKKLNTLSFGQKKKFLLSFGLATNVKLLFLDEPTNGLDIPSKSQFRKTVARAINEDKSIIISTHQARDLESLIDTIIILEEGKVLFNAPCFEVTEKLYFGKSSSFDKEEGVIYKEDSIGGYKIVTPSKGKDESLLDMELFFNAIVSNPQEVNACFKN
ncbi:MAG: ABC transporter ATP-binding protein [Bacteroidales bacterium]|nr:ABC transporter ATP-binding protein [Bacteroidales bacterium]MBN2818798.1 ABC transporter ATP-binding protein [Bacteroidales bacterium]